MSDVMIAVDHLIKDYGTGKPAVADISFEVRRGEVLGFLGPNGAGKTTTMKILTSYLAPTSGSATVAGHDVYSDSLEVRRRIGYLGEDTPLYREMTVLEYLEHICELRKVPHEGRRARLRKVVEQCSLGDRLGTLIDELSKGLRQRVGLAQAIIHEPEVLILDEPTSGLDPNQITDVRRIIKEIGQEKTVIFSTHILGEVQATCSRVVIISDGKIVADGTIEELSRRTHGEMQIDLELGGPRAASDFPVDLLKKIDGVHDAWVKEQPNAERPSVLIGVTAEPGKDPRGDIARVLASSDELELLQLLAQKASLEDVFRKLTSPGKSN